MLIRDKIGEQLEKQLGEYTISEVELVRLSSNEELFNALIQKINNELQLLLLTKSIDNLAEIIELIDWLQICLGTSHINNIVEHRKEKMGLYYKRYFLREKEPSSPLKEDEDD